MTNNSINVFQKEWAFTSSESQIKKIQTGTIGSCYVVTFTSGKFAAMAHLDDNTNVDSIENIFNKFLENSVNLKDVKVIVLGGWHEHAESRKWGEKIVKKINEAGFKSVSIKQMYTKKVFRLQGTIDSIDHYFHFGAIIDSSNGQTYLLKKYSESIDQEQASRIKEFSENFTPDTELALKEVFK